MQRLLVPSMVMAAILALLVPATASADILPSAGTGGGVSPANVTPLANPSDVLFTNGPTNGTLSAWTINFGFQVSDAFTLGQTSHLTGVSLGLWVDPGAVPTSLDWTISTGPTGGGVGNGSTTPAGILASGTASGSQLTNTLFATGAFGFYDIYNTSFPLDVTLPAGSYYLSFGPNSTASDGGPIYWDINNGPTTAFENTIGNTFGTPNEDTGVSGTNSDAFTIFGISAPEPTSMALFGMAVLGAVGYYRRRSRKPVA